MIDETDRIRQDELLSEDGRDIFPKINRRRRTIVKVGPPFMRPGGKEGHTSRVYLVMFQRCRIGVPVHPEGRLPRVIRLAGTGRIIQVARRRAIRNTGITQSRHRRLLFQCYRPGVRYRRPGRQYYNELIHSRRRSRGKDNDRWIGGRVVLRHNCCHGRVFDPNIVINRRNLPGPRQLDLVLGGIVTGGSGSDGWIDRESKYAAGCVRRAAIRLAESHSRQVRRSSRAVGVRYRTIGPAQRSSRRSGRRDREH